MKTFPDIQPIPSLELFAGAGGLGLGLARAGFHPESMIEQDSRCCKTIGINSDLFRNTENSSFLSMINMDVRDVDFTPYEGQVDLVSGGPPCQPFSFGGRHRAYDDTRDMFPQAVRAIREIRPKAFVLENVKGLTRPAFSEYLHYIQLQLEHPEITGHEDELWQDHRNRLIDHHASPTRRSGLHYNIVMKLLNAADYGVPQCRQRVFIAGFRDDLNLKWEIEPGNYSQEALVWDIVYGTYCDRHQIPKTSGFPECLLESRSARRIASGLSPGQRPSTKAWRTTRDAIGDLPDPQDEQAVRTCTAQIPNHEYQPGARSYKGHTGSAMDTPSKTLKAGVHGVPGGENMLRRSDGSVRYFTVRESARLQTFPDEYRFYGSWTKSLQQIGNAVPVKLAQSVGDSIFALLFSPEHDLVESSSPVSS